MLQKMLWVDDIDDGACGIQHQVLSILQVWQNHLFFNCFPFQGLNYNGYQGYTLEDGVWNLK